MTNNNEFELIVKPQVGTINYNFNELNEKLDIELKKYNKLVFTDENMKEAKEIRSQLNKAVTAINANKISIKKTYCEPYFQFEEEAKKLMGKIKEVNDKIDIQIKDYEERIKIEKKRQIEEWYTENGNPLIELERIFDSKWLNKTVTTIQWVEQLTSILERIKADLNALEQMADKNINLLKTMYLESLDLTTTINKYTYQQQMQERLQQAKEQEEKVIIQPQITKETNKGITQNITPSNLLRRVFRVIGTEEQIIKLGDFMNENGIEFEKIDF